VESNKLYGEVVGFNWSSCLVIVWSISVLAAFCFLLGGCVASVMVYVKLSSVM